MTCPLDYSTDDEGDSLALFPISPVSPCEDDKTGHEEENGFSDDQCKSQVSQQVSTPGLHMGLATNQAILEITARIEQPRRAWLLLKITTFSIHPS
jgi:hypothetical protein